MNPVALSDWTPEELARFSEKEEKRKQANRERCQRYQARKHREVLEKGGGKCAQCGEDDLELLHIDEHDKTKSWSQRYNAILNGKSDVRLLCAKCNWKKRHTHNEATGRPRRP